MPISVRLDKETETDISQSMPKKYFESALAGNPGWEKKNDPWIIKTSKSTGPPVFAIFHCCPQKFDRRS
jgi:hypothetical protein